MPPGCDTEVAAPAYLVALLHAAKHPHAPVCGVLLAPDTDAAGPGVVPSGGGNGSGGANGGAGADVDFAVPLLHTAPNLPAAPLLLAADLLASSLSQVNSQTRTGKTSESANSEKTRTSFFASTKRKVVGAYYAKTPVYSENSFKPLFDAVFASCGTQDVDRRIFEIDLEMLACISERAKKNKITSQTSGKSSSGVNGSCTATAACRTAMKQVSGPGLNSKNSNAVTVVGQKVNFNNLREILALSEELYDFDDHLNNINRDWLGQEVLLKNLDSVLYAE